MRPFALVAALAAAVALPGPAVAAPTDYAVLIGVKAHDNKKLDLACSTIDVYEVRRALVERGQVPPANILALVDGDKDREPTCANISAEVPRFLKRVPKGARVIVYFSGHGWSDEAGTLLVPKDFNTEEPAARGVPVATVRDWVSRCAAGSKFLLLDCCHAGGGVAKPAGGADLARGLSENLDRCVVLASSGADEFSYEWPVRDRSVFTFWLCRALEGAAADRDGRVELEAVRKYVTERVAETAKHLGGTQTPVQYGTLKGEQVLLTLAPETPETACRRVATQMDMDIRRKKLKSVGVLEFTMPVGKELKPAYATQPRYCANLLAEELKKLAGGDYQVAPPGPMSAAAVKAEFDLQNSGEVAALKRLGRELAATGGPKALDAVVLGDLRKQADNVLLRCELVTTADAGSVHESKERFALTEGGVADRGGSFTYVAPDPQFRGANKPNERPTGADPHDPKVLTKLEELLAQPNPLLDKDCLFKVAIRSKGATDPKPFVPLTRDGNAVAVAARDGEVFEIDFRSNYTDSDVGMVLLADGINVLGAKRERIETARLWVLEPKKDYTIQGWTVDKDSSPDVPGFKDAKLRDDDTNFTVTPFQFVGASQSVAARQGYTNSLGVITVAFYARAKKGEGKDRSAGNPNDLGVGKKDTGKTNVKLKTVPFEAGELLAAFNIRYINEAELEKVKKARK